MRSDNSRCEMFSSIATFGKQLLFPDWNGYDGQEQLNLPFEFPWRNKTTTKAVLVSTDGLISFDDGEKEISVAKTPLDPTAGGSIYTAQISDSMFVVSWEGVRHTRWNKNELVTFQIVLYANGEIEFRWEDGKLPKSVSIIAGLRDDEEEIEVLRTSYCGWALPVTGDSFFMLPIPYSKTPEGVWPRNQCRLFVPDGSGYDDYNEIGGSDGGSSIGDDDDDDDDDDDNDYDGNDGGDSGSSSVNNDDDNDDGDYNNHCSLFQPILSIATSKITLLEDFSEEGIYDIELPFDFEWGYSLSSEPIKFIQVNKKGYISIIGIDRPGFPCTHEIIIANLKETDDDTEVDASYSGNIYAATTGRDSFVISYEGVNPLGDTGYEVNFQAVLFANGRVELRWGDGSYPDSHIMSAYLSFFCGNRYSNYSGEAIPEGDPFVKDNERYWIDGFTNAGTWPSNQCRKFILDSNQDDDDRSYADATTPTQSPVFPKL